VALAAAVVVTIVACTPSFPLVFPEDAGNYAYARQIIPAIYGRKIRGYEETKLIADFIVATDRKTVTRALMAQPEFVDHWAEVLVDDLHVTRVDSVSQTPTQQASCFADQNIAAGNGTGIADQLTANSPTTAFNGGAIKMGDVVRSSIVADNLFPLYRADLFATTLLPVSGDSTELQRRDVFGNSFDEVFLNRQMGCLTCHNSESSTTDNSSGWNRHFPIPGFFERALWGNKAGAPLDQAHAMFRSQNGGTNPWGLSNCGSYTMTPGIDPENINAFFTQNQGKQFGVNGLQAILKNGYNDLKADGLNRTLDPPVQQQCNFCANNCSGNNLSWQAMADNATGGASVKALVTSTCTVSGCHGTALNTGAAGMGFPNDAQWASNLQSRVTPGNANTSTLFVRTSATDGSRMPPPPKVALTVTQVNLIKNWINSMPSGNSCATCGALNCSGPRNFVKGPEAFSYLVAAHISDNIWKELTGTPLTIANYFPRNAAQRDILWNLTEYTFIPKDWSLKSVVEKVVLSNLYNRKPPKTTALANSYVLPPVFNPWTPLDTRVPPVSDAGYDANAHPQNHQNAMTEGVHRYSAQTLIQAVSKSLDWPKPKRFPAVTDVYPTVSLLRTLGFHFNDVQPANRIVDFQGLLAWETVHGRCTKPTGVTTDWIDKLTNRINTFNAANPGSPLSVDDVVTAMRDWLMGYGGISTNTPVGLASNEQDMLKTHFGVAALTDPISGVADLDTKLRALCGMQLETAQFLLAGIVESDLGPQPRIRICNSTDCSYQEMCAVIAPAVQAQLPPKTAVICGSNSITIFHLPDPPVLVDICPPGICGVLDRYINKGCPIMAFGGDPIGGGPIGGAPGAPIFARSFCPSGPPSCDPRCSRIDCCGGPLPRDLSGGDLLMVWGDHAHVQTVGDVRIMPAEQNQFVELTKDRELHAGDLLALRAGSRLQLKTRDGKLIKTAKEGFDKSYSDKVIMMMITGETVLANRDQPPSTEDKAVAREELVRLIKERNPRGEAGRSVTFDELTKSKYSAEEMDLTDLRKRGLLPEQIKNHDPALPDQRKPEQKKPGRAKK